MALIFRRRHTTRPEVVHPNLSGPLTASSVQVQPDRWGGKIGKPTSEREDWQGEAWKMVDLVGELRFAVEWTRNLLSRFRLVASDLDPQTGRPTGSTKNQAAIDIVRRIAGGTSGQSQMMGRLGVLLFVPAEGYLAVIFPDGVEEWHVLSREEVKSSVDGSVEIGLPDGGKYSLNQETDTLFRIWRPSGRKAAEADSPVKAALPILREIVRMTQNIEAAGKSRQAGNGILFLPEEVTMSVQPPPTGQRDPDAPNLPASPAVTRPVHSDEIRETLQRVMSTAITNPAAAEALVPLIMQVRGEWIKEIRHLRFESDLTKESRETRVEAVRRLALTLDMPPEVLLGKADLNHWNAWATKEEAVQWYSASIAETICEALTRWLLGPMLERDGAAADTVIWYTAADVTEKPDTWQQESWMFEHGLLTGDALVRATGRSADDTYDLTSLGGWQSLAGDVVRQHPELLPVWAPIVSTVTGVDVAPQVDTAAALTAAVSDVFTQRALELAAKRRRTRANHGVLRDVPVAGTHQALGPCAAEDVPGLIRGWDATLVDSCARSGLDPDVVRDRVTDAVAGVLTGGVA